MPEPEYTDEARKAHKEGNVVLWLVVRADGTVGDVKVARSLDKGLDENAVEAVKKWRFQPARRDGKAVAVQMNVEVHFTLASSGSDETLKGSVIETSKDGGRWLANPSMGLHIALPTGWVQVSIPPVDHGSSITSIKLNRKETFASLLIQRQVVEASPEIYPKVIQQFFRMQTPTLDVLREESISKSDWTGIRWLISETHNDIKSRCIVDIYSRENLHYFLTACAPDDVFDKDRQDFEVMLGSVEFTDVSAKSVLDTK